MGWRNTYRGRELHSVELSQSEKILEITRPVGVDAVVADAGSTPWGCGGQSTGERVRATVASQLVDQRLNR